MSLISPHFVVKSMIFPNFGQGPFPKTAGPGCQTISWIESKLDEAFVDMEIRVAKII